MSTILDRIGGGEVLAAALSKTFEYVQQDDLLDGYFSGTSIDHISSGVAHYLSSALSGSSMQAFKPLHMVHNGNQINDEAFDRWVGCFSRGLSVTGVPRGAIDEAVAVVASMRNQVIDGFVPNPKFSYQKK